MPVELVSLSYFKTIDLLMLAGLSTLLLDIFPEAQALTQDF